MSHLESVESFEHPFWSHLSPFLGRGVVENVPQQVMGMFAMFLAMGKMSHYFSGFMVDQYSKMGNDEKRKWNSYVVSMVHCLVVSTLCVGLVVFPDFEMETDRIYGYSERASFVFAVSAGYFLYDLTNCYDSKSIHYQFVAHHLACFLCYLFVQYPFLQYYAVRLLLYEISTPFLNLRFILLMLGQKNTPILSVVEKCFGLSFFIVRIAMGLPLSVMAISDGLQLYTEGKQHSTFILFYFILANILCNGLNIFWGNLLVQKALAKTNPKTSV